jgi:hypothetical protein
MQVFQKNSLFVSATFILFVLLIMQGNAESQGQTDCLITNDITITQQVSGEGVSTSNENIYFIPGKLLNITITFTKNTSESILALGLQCTVPQGWQYQGTFGHQCSCHSPTIRSSSDEVPLRVCMDNHPTFPFNFTFSANNTLRCSGTLPDNYSALYRLTAGQICSNIAQHLLFGETTHKKEKVRAKAKVKAKILAVQFLRVVIV